MKSSTKSFVTHRTEFKSEQKLQDGGRWLLLDLFDFIHSEKQVGKMTAQFGVGGCISSLIFEETEAIAQGEIEVQ